MCLSYRPALPRRPGRRGEHAPRGVRPPGCRRLIARPGWVEASAACALPWGLIFRSESPGPRPLPPSPGLPALPGGRAGAVGAGVHGGRRRTCLSVPQPWAWPGSRPPRLPRSLAGRLRWLCLLGILNVLATVEVLLQTLFPVKPPQRRLLLQGVTPILPSSPRGAPEEVWGHSSGVGRPVHCLPACALGLLCGGEQSQPHRSLGLEPPRRGGGRGSGADQQAGSRVCLLSEVVTKGTVS